MPVCIDGVVLKGARLSGGSLTGAAQPTIIRTRT